ncbi:MAG: Trm112 family protein [Rhodanobacter sp.]
MDKRLLDILCCPVSKTPVRPLNHGELDALNGAIASGSVQTVAGKIVDVRVGEALITTDGKVIYRVDDGIPVMLPEEGIGTTQLTDFPALA